MRRYNLDDAALVRAARGVYAQWAVRDWRRRGEPAPPPSAVKQEALREYARRFGPRVFLETGTYYADTLFYLVNDFDRLISIELDPTYHTRAKARLRRFPQVELIQGDSATLVEQVIHNIDEPVLFWLDAHFMGQGCVRGHEDSPISAELDAVLNHRVRDHVVLIDDAAWFSGRDGYPTIGELRDSVFARRPDLNFEVRHDVIRITPGHG
jgi:hypothetical protein